MEFDIQEKDKQISELQAENLKIKELYNLVRKNDTKVEIELKKEISLNKLEIERLNAILTILRTDNEKLNLKINRLIKDYPILD
jgi:hypothetical protein